ncbi:MAG: class I SAM-dependent methyltransferase [Proteobacteria bacterium]|nr:class I SAM-dependent methyltransferase [Pseudomonadota bacterium]
MANPLSTPGENYRCNNIEQAITQALEQARKDQQPFDPALIAALDQFHIGGLPATLAMLEIAGLDSDDLLLDVGCGLGGPARVIATQTGCRVVGVDLSADYCSAAELISKRLNLAARTQFTQANALALPFSENHFSALWAQHVTMNIEKKAALWQEFARVLNHDGKLLMYEVMLGDGNSDRIEYPMPWTRQASTSFLASADDYRESLSSCGFDISIWQDVSSEALESVSRVVEMLSQGKIKQPNLSLLLGDQYQPMMLNLAKALRENALQVVQVVAHNG